MTRPVKWPERLDYWARYHRKRYQGDPEYRERKRAQAREYARRKRAERLEALQKDVRR